MVGFLKRDEIERYYSEFAAVSNQYQTDALSDIQDYYKRFPHYQMGKQKDTIRFDISSYFENIASYIESDRECLRRSNPHLNIWKSVGLGYNELRHCAFLAWLLDPTGDHGQQDLFLRSFLTHIPGLKHLIQFLGSKRISVFREDSYGEKGRVDIYIKSDQFLILIEAKLNANEQHDQLNRSRAILNADTAAMGIDHMNALSIFLTLDGRMPITGEADICLSWKDIVTSLKVATDACENKFLTSIITQYRCFMLDYIY